MTQVEVFEAGTRLAELMAEAERGEEVVLTRRGQAVGRLVPLGPPPGQPVPPDPREALQNLARLRSVIAARGVSVTDEEIRAARDESGI